MAKKKEKTILDAVKATRPRFVAPSQVFKSKRGTLLKKAESKAAQE